MTEFPTRRPSSRERIRKHPVRSSRYPSFFARMLLSGILCCMCMIAANCHAFDPQTAQLKTLLSSGADPKELSEQVRSAIGFCREQLQKSVTEVGAEPPQEPIGQNAAAEPPQEQYVSATQTVFSLPLSGAITSGFGDREDPFDDSSAWHTGLDIAANAGVPIAAAADGEVIFAGELGGYGNAVKIRHPSGLVTLYGHCSELFVNVGDAVCAGDEIAAVGSTGRSTGPHLHFEIIDGEQYLDPTEFLNFV